MSILRKIFRLSEPISTDPIDHPDLRRMTSRELADLPFPRNRWEAHADTMLRDTSTDIALSSVSARSCPGRSEAAQAEQ